MPSRLERDPPPPFTVLLQPHPPAELDLQLTNVTPADAASCRTCGLFINPDQEVCLTCANQPDLFDLVAPITYAPRGGPVYSILREYKDAKLLQHGTYAVIRVSGILWRFLDDHLTCIAAASGVEHFDFATVVPSADPEADERRSNLRDIAAWCGPLRDHYRRLIEPTGTGRWGRAFDPHRYRANRPLGGKSTLLIDDTWVTGGHAQSAAHALREAGATTVSLVVVGRYLRRQWPAGNGLTCGDRLDILPPHAWTHCPLALRLRTTAGE